MKFFAIGRTRTLIDSCQVLVEDGHDLVGVVTCPAEDYYSKDENDFATLASDADAFFISSRNLASADVMGAIRSSNADIAISVNWPLRIPCVVRNLFSHGILNAHAGDLPRYRGNATPNWAILNGESNVGLCIHLMDDELDAGDVLVRDYLPLDDEPYIADVYDWIFKTCPTLFAQALNGLETGDLSPLPQDTVKTLPLRCYPRLPEDGLIDWSQSTENITRLVRASSRPFAGAFSYLRDQKIIIWRASSYQTLPFCAVPGQVCLNHQNYPAIACSDGMVLIEEAEIVDVSDDKKTRQIILKSLRHRLGRPID